MSSSLAHCSLIRYGRTGANGILESNNLRRQLLVDIIALVDSPEFSETSLLDQVLKSNQVNNRLLCDHLLVQEIQAQVEIRLGKSSESLDQDVVDDLVVGQMGVKLVPV